MADLNAHFEAILKTIGDAKRGLTKPVFLFISQLTPLVNVDLLIQNTKGQTLLTWREDNFYGPGWHVPGGVIRFKEHAAKRIEQVAQTELHVTVSAESDPLCVREVMAADRDVRGHFISLLYRCSLTSPLDEKLTCKLDTPHLNSLQPGCWQWHDGCPQNIIPQHEMYRSFMNKGI